MWRQEAIEKGGSEVVTGRQPPITVLRNKEEELY